MNPTDITALGQTLFGEPWLEKMADTLGYSTSQLWRVAYGGAPVTRRMSRELDRLVKRRARKLTSGNAAKDSVSVGSADLRTMRDWLNDEHGTGGQTKLASLLESCTFRENVYVMPPG